MPDKLGLLDSEMPLQVRYDKFLLWLSSKNHAVIEFMARELEISVSEVDVFSKLGDLNEEEFEIIDTIGYDVGHLFIIVRSPKEVRKIMYDKHKEILNSAQPLTALKMLGDEHSDYTSIEDLIQKISGDCWKSVSSYLRQRNFQNGTITKGIRSMLMNVGTRVNKQEEISDPQLDWLVRALQHDHGNGFAIFTNDTVKNDFHEDYRIFLKIHEHIERYATN